MALGRHTLAVKLAAAYAPSRPRPGRPRRRAGRSPPAHWPCLEATRSRRRRPPASVDALPPPPPRPRRAHPLRRAGGVRHQRVRPRRRPGARRGLGWPAARRSLRRCRPRAAPDLHPDQPARGGRPRAAGACIRCCAPTPPAPSRVAGRRARRRRPRAGRVVCGLCARLYQISSQSRRRGEHHRRAGVGAGAQGGPAGGGPLLGHDALLARPWQNARALAFLPGHRCGRAGGERDGRARGPRARAQPGRHVRANREECWPHG